MQVIIHNTFLEEILNYVCGIIFNFCLPVQSFLLCDIPETRNLAKCHTTSRTYKTDFFSSHMCWINSTFSITYLNFFTPWNRKNYVSLVYSMDVLLGPHRRSLALAVLSLLFDIEASDSSSPLFFSSSLSSSTIIFRTVKYEILESKTFDFDLCSIFNQHKIV